MDRQCRGRPASAPVTFGQCMQREMFPNTSLRRRNADRTLAAGELRSEPEDGTETCQAFIQTTGMKIGEGQLVVAPFVDWVSRDQVLAECDRLFQAT